MSTSAWSLQSMVNETASVNLKIGPPLIPENSTPSRKNCTTMALPAGPGPASVYRVTVPTFELGKMET